MNKKFKTYNSQMKHLRDSKGISCRGSRDKQILIQYGYFNLINGYKTPFIKGRNENGNHVYMNNT